jgi:hypothetical protein
VNVIGTVSEVIAISGRGIALFFKSSPRHITELPSLTVLISRPDGSASTFAASREFARVVGAPDGEVVTLFIAGASPAQVPLGSVVKVAAPSGV